MLNQSQYLICLFEKASTILLWLFRDLLTYKMSAEDMKMKVMGEVTGMMGVMLLNLGKETGVWKAMRGGESVTPSQLAKTSGLSERYLEDMMTRIQPVPH